VSWGLSFFLGLYSGQGSFREGGGFRRLLFFFFFPWLSRVLGGGGLFHDGSFGVFGRYFYTVR